MKMQKALIQRQKLKGENEVKYNNTQLYYRKYMQQIEELHHFEGIIHKRSGR